MITVEIPAASLQIMFIVEKQHKYDGTLFSILEHRKLYNLPLEILWHIRLLGVCTPLLTISWNAFQVYSLYGGLYHRTQVS